MTWNLRNIKKPIRYWFSDVFYYKLNAGTDLRKFKLESFTLSLYTPLEAAISYSTVNSSSFYYREEKTRKKNKINKEEMERLKICRKK